MDKQYQLEFPFMQEMYSKEKKREKKEEKWRREAEIRGGAWKMYHSSHARARREAQDPANRQYIVSDKYR